MGLGALIAFGDAGYGHIEVDDPNSERMAMVPALGGQALNRRNAQRFSLVFECNGAHAARDFAIQTVLPEGAVILVSENPFPWTITETPIFRRKDFYLIRSFYFPVGEHPENFRLLDRQRHRYERLMEYTLARTTLRTNIQDSRRANI